MARSTISIGQFPHRFLYVYQAGYPILSWPMLTNPFFAGESPGIAGLHHLHRFFQEHLGRDELLRIVMKQWT
jgi:hypothetical protein